MIDNKNIKIAGVRSESNDTFWTIRPIVDIIWDEHIIDPILNIRLAPFLDIQLPSQRISICVNGEVVYENILTENKLYEITVQLPNAAKFNLTINLPDSESPHNLNTGDDEDLLGILLHEFSIVPLQFIKKTLFEKIEWGFQKSKLIKSASVKILKTEEFNARLSNIALKKLKSIADSDILTLSYYEYEKLDSLALQPNILNKIEEWASMIHLFNEELMKANNYLTYKEVAAYQPSERLLEYYEKDLYSELVKDVKQNNLKLNSKEILNHKIEIDSIPPYMFFSMINVCNLSCVMCYQSQIQFYKHLMDDDVLVKIFEYLPYSHYISVSGLGEPILSPSFKFFASVSNQLRSYTYLISNGMLLDKKQESTSLITEIAISFDASSKETFEHLRKGANFDKIRNNILNFSSKYPNVALAFSSTISRLSLPEMSGIVEHAHQLGVKTVNINAIYDTPLLGLIASDFPIFQREQKIAQKLADKYRIKLLIHITEEHFKNQGDPLYPDLFFDKLAKLIDISSSKFDFDIFARFIENHLLHTVPFEWKSNESTGNDDIPFNALSNNWTDVISSQKISLNQQRTSKTNIDIPYCLNPWNLLFVKEDGTVRLCCNSDRYMGDLKTHSIREIVNNDAFQHVRKSMIGQCAKPPECVTCKAGNRYIGEENLNSLSDSLLYIAKKKFNFLKLKK